jgi:hypothetical protein
MEGFPMPHEVAVLFTFKSVERLVREGGTSAWRLDRTHARRCHYAVCTRNAHSEHTEGSEPHHTAFLIGKVSDVVPVGHNGRFLIQFSEYAHLNIPNSWHGGRNPVSYSTLENLGIDVHALDWQPMPEPEGAELSPATPRDSERGLTMAEAKAGLARTFGVSPEAIASTIRG